MPILNNISTIPIAIAEDSLLFAQALEALLQQQGTTDIIFTANSGASLLSQLEKTQPKVILMDIRMPDVDGLEATTKVKELYPDIYVIVLSNYHDIPTVKSALKAGADGYLLKDIDADELHTALIKVAEGETYFCERVRDLIISTTTKKPKPVKRGTDFSAVPFIITDRECDVLSLICEEMTSEEMTGELFISKNTIETHRRNLLAKLNCKTSIGLVKWAIKNKLYNL